MVGKHLTHGVVCRTNIVRITMAYIELATIVTGDKQTEERLWRPVCQIILDQSEMSTISSFSNVQE